jgi:hypothetical protein
VDVFRCPACSGEYKLDMHEYMRMRSVESTEPVIIAGLDAKYLSPPEQEAVNWEKSNPKSGCAGVLIFGVMILGSITAVGIKLVG